MKDKRQRMAFTWPYGDPQMFAYMLSAVAATGYNNQPNSSQMQPVMQPIQSYESQQQDLLKHKNSTPKLVINTEADNQLNLSIKTPSPNVSISSSSSLSSSCSSSSANISTTPTKKLNLSDDKKISSPISLYIPSTQNIFTRPNYEQSPALLDSSFNQYRNNLLVPPPGLHVPHPVSFKSPAFGLANNDQQSFRPIDNGFSYLNY